MELGWNLVGAWLLSELSGVIQLLCTTRGCPVRTEGYHPRIGRRHSMSASSLVSPAKWPETTKTNLAVLQRPSGSFVKVNHGVQQMLATPPPSGRPSDKGILSEMRCQNKRLGKIIDPAKHKQGAIAACFSCVLQILKRSFSNFSLKFGRHIWCFCSDPN